MNFTRFYLGVLLSISIIMTINIYFLGPGYDFQFCLCDFIFVQVILSHLITENNILPLINSPVVQRLLP